MLGTLASPSTQFLHFTHLSAAGKFRSESVIADPETSVSRPVSLYEILGVKKNASAMEIKSAYRSLAKLYHPDSSESSNGGDFIEIHKAYSTLSDASARALYDLSQRRPLSSSNQKEYYTPRRWETDQCW